MSSVNIYFSDYFGVDPVDLADFGAFDVSLVNDLPLFVDPFLLFNSEKEEYRSLHDEILRYMRFLKELASEGEISDALLDAWFKFPEVKQNWFGYSLKGNSGRGLGEKFALALDRGFRTVFRDFGQETVTRSSHLEKLTLLHQGVGRDNISDFTTNLIKGFLAAYTQEFAKDYIGADLVRRVPVTKVAFNYDTQSWITGHFDLPWFGGDFVLLTPRDILTKDETWINRADLLDRFELISASLPNATLRAQVNDYLRRVLPRGPKVTKAETRDAIAGAAEKFPEVLDYYVREKEDNGHRAKQVSEQRVANVEKQFVEQVRLLVASYLEPAGFYRFSGNTYEEAMERVRFLKDAIENKGAHRILYVNGEPIQREADLQILYRLTWFATPSDVSREVNDGRGPADFKISRGSADKTIVEFKLGKNTQLERNLQKQAEIYERASDATQPSIKVILYFDLRQKRRVERILKRLDLLESPHIVLVDACFGNKLSASKA